MKRWNLVSVFLGGCERFFSELGRRPPVSDGHGAHGCHRWSSLTTPRMGKGGRASTRRASSLRAGTAPAPGTSAGWTGYSDRARQVQPPAASEAAEDGKHPGIQGETRRQPPGRKGIPPVTNYKTWIKRDRERGEALVWRVRTARDAPASGDHGREESRGERHTWSRRGSENPARTQRPGIKGKAKRLEFQPGRKGQRKPPDCPVPRDLLGTH